MCIQCDRGYYSEKYGSKYCSPCLEGTFNPSPGGNTARQCYPCPQDNYNDLIGSSNCKSCPAGKFCPVGSKQPLSITLSTNSVSVQPKLYSKSSSKAENMTLTMISTMAAIGAVIICIFLFIRKIRRYLKSIDLYSDKHNYELNAPMKLMKTEIGGFFTIIFIILAIILISSDSIRFKLNNIDETKALVPLVTLENDVDEFPAEQLTIISTFFRYGGDCVEDSKCHESISKELYYLTNDDIEMTCSKSTENDCTIEIKCKNCVLDTGAYIQLNLLEKQSYTSAISVNVTSSSSIPNEISSIYQVLFPSSNAVFRGFKATQFYFSMTPSLFRSYVDIWDSKLTGYHVSVASPAIGGSQYQITELPFTSDLKLKIWLDKSDTSLYTTRLAKQSWIILVTSLLGSIFGIMSAIGGIMRMFEKNYHKIRHTYTHSKNKAKIYKERDGFKNMLHYSEIPVREETRTI